MMPSYRDGWTVGNTNYMPQRPGNGADIRGEGRCMQSVTSALGNGYTALTAVMPMARPGREHLMTGQCFGKPTRMRPMSLDGDGAARIMKLYQ